MNAGKSLAKLLNQPRDLIGCHTIALTKGAWEELTQRIGITDEAHGVTQRCAVFIADKLLRPNHIGIVQGGEFTHLALARHTRDIREYLKCRTALRVNRTLATLAHVVSLCKRDRTFPANPNLHSGSPK